MIRWLALLVFSIALVATARGPAWPAVEPADASLVEARAQLAAAERNAAVFQRKAARTKGEAERLRAMQIAAAQDIDVAEARISATAIEARSAERRAAADRQRLRAEQQPVAALLGGLALMAQRPPLLVLADSKGTDELVRVKLLLDSTMPAIRARTAALRSAIRRSDELAGSALLARHRLAQSRSELVDRRRRFAALEQRALGQSLASQGDAIEAGDVALVAGERIADFEADRESTSQIRNIARRFASDPPAPSRPFAGSGQSGPDPVAYRLPSEAPVIEGLGAFSLSGVRSRGLTLATTRGALLTSPAAGIIRFTGPFGGYDGVVIIDHGGGWISVLVNAAARVRKGEQVSIGAPIARALGPVMIELSRNGRRVSPALIAGSSRPLSNGAEGG